MSSSTRTTVSRRWPTRAAPPASAEPVLGRAKRDPGNDDTTRVIKRGPGGEVIYVNQWYVDNAGKNSKHVFAGTTRLVTKLEMPPKSQPPGQQPPGGGTGTTEKFFYFYHPDHLGSTSYVTDQSGEVYQHLEYFPFGEAWVDESPGNSTDRTPYRFTGKEFDEETGLYYFGARYYDPRISLWTAADPALGDYLNRTKEKQGVPDVASNWRNDLTGPGLGGAFQPKNHNLYGYAQQNPLRLTDPDGNIPVDTVWDIGNVIVDVAAIGYHRYWTGDKIAEKEAKVDLILDGAATLIPYVPAGASKVARFFRRGGCSFDASTLVTTKDGLKRIDHLSVNELVLAKNEETGETAYKQITDMFVNTHAETVRLTLRTQDSDREEEVLASLNHPFFVIGRGWLSVSELSVGDKIEVSDGSWARLLAKTVEPKELRAYSLEVAEHHTFYVGETGAWVHNGDPDLYFGQKRISETFRNLGSDAPDWIRGKSISEVAETMKNDPTKRVHLEYFKDSQGRKIVTTSRGLAAYVEAGISPPDEILKEITPDQDKLNRLTELPNGEPTKSIDVTVGKKNPEVKRSITAKFPCK